MAQNYFDWNEESKRETVLAKSSDHPVPDKNSHWVVVKDGGNQKCRLPSFGSILLQCLTHQESGQQRVLLAAVIMIANNLENNVWHLIKESQ